MSPTHPTVAPPLGRRPATGRVQGPGSGLRAIGPHYVIAPPVPADHPLRALLSALRPVPGSLIVLAAAADAAPVLRAELPVLAHTASERGDMELVLAAAGLAAPAADGRRTASRMAEATGLTVTAPDEPVSVRADGTLTTGADGSWWRCPPAGPPERLGPGWPPPRADGPLVQPIPAGYWIRSRKRPTGIDPGILDAVSATTGTSVVVVGTPERPHLAPERLAESVAALALPADELLLSAPWTVPSRLAELAARVAQRLDRPVRVAIGLPMRTAGGYSSLILDRNGAPAWEPFLTELTAFPGERRVVGSAWLSGPRGWEAAEPATYRVLPDWRLEAVPAGLWLRPDGAPADPAPRLLPPDPRGPLLVVGEPSRPVAPEVRHHVDGMLDALPPELRPRRVIFPGNADDTAPAPASVDLRPRPGPVSVPRDPVRGEGPTESAELPWVSDTASRAAFREQLGAHYARCASRAGRVATRLPGLRSTPRDDLRPDLVAVLLHHADTGVPAGRAELIAAARAARPGPLTPYLTCLGSGLRRLPSHHGAVLLAARADPDELGAYVPGTLLHEPAPVCAVTSHAVELDAPVEFAVWSTTGRRTSLFDHDAEPAEVVFPPGTRFTVLAPPDGTAPGRPVRVLLRESAGPGQEEDDELDRAARERLLGWLERRDRLAPQERRPVANPARFHLAPGLVAPRLAAATGR